MRVGVGVLLFLCALFVEAAPPAGYYNAAENKTGTELRLALHSIIRAHRVIPYSSSSFDTSDALKVLDEDPANTNAVILLYAGRSEPKSTFGVATGWNREHMWPNSYGLDDSGPEYSDLFNLRAEDWNVNSARGNEYYDNGGAKPADPEAPQCASDSDSWEPPSAMKGDIARAMFYMDVRYEGTSGEPDLILTDRTIEGSINQNTNLMGRLTTLLQWHFADPVDDAERLRNDRIHELYQRNRNPFVDRPEWVAAVFLPEIRTTSSGNQIQFTWPATYWSAVIQQTHSLSSPWVDMRQGAALAGQQWGVVLPATNAGNFFRLRLP